MTEKHIAVIGAGYWGKNLVRNFHQLGVLKTICDRAQPIREEMTKTYPSYSLSKSGSSIDPGRDPILEFIGGVSHGSLAKDIDRELYGENASHFHGGHEGTWC